MSTTSDPHRKTGLEPGNAHPEYSHDGVMRDVPCERSGFLDGLSRLIGKGTLCIPRYYFHPWAMRGIRRRMDRTDGQRFKAVSHDGTTLACVRFAAKHPTDRPTVVIAHGWMEVKECHLRTVELLVGEGHDVILFDQRGHGDSGGRFTTFGVWEQHDVRAVVDEVESRGWLRGGVATMGLSLGAAAVLMHAADDPRVQGVVAVAPFASYAEAVRSYHRIYGPWLCEKWVLRGHARAARDFGFEMRETAVIDAVRRLTCPVLLAVGEHDKHLSRSRHTQRVADALPDDDARPHVIRGANHFNPFRAQWPGFDDKIVSFLNDTARDVREPTQDSPTSQSFEVPLTVTN